MLKTRIIPCLDVKDGRVVKGINFLDLIFKINIFFFFISTNNIEFNFGTHSVPSPSNALVFHMHFGFEFFIDKLNVLFDVVHPSDQWPVSFHHLVLSTMVVFCPYPHLEVYPL